jgi:dihydrofolate reductase
VGRLILNAAMSLNGAYEAPQPAPQGWLVLDPESQQASLDRWHAAEAMVMGRATYEGLSAVWPQMADLPGLEAYAERMNTMPKYVASRTLSAPLGWNATLVEGDAVDGMRALKDRRQGELVITGLGELAKSLLGAGLVDELRVAIHPFVWPHGPRLLDGIAAELELVDSRVYASGVTELQYRLV